jgi:hypothetical protein
LILDLWKKSIFAEGPKVKTSSGKQSNKSYCCHYEGVVEGEEEHSVASFSVCTNEISGLVNYKGHQYTLGKFGDKAGSEVFYRQDQLKSKPSFNPDTAKYLPNSPMLN